MSMEVILIRHGEPDYLACEERGLVGHNKNFAPLTPLGENQAEAISHSLLLRGSQLILSSPYTRALQTASILAAATGISLAIHVDLREWQPDQTFQYRTSEELQLLRQDFFSCKGRYPAGETRRWEEIDGMIRRISPVIRSYYKQDYRKIIVVAHGGIIRRFTGNVEVNFCTPYPISYHSDYQFFHWV